MNNPDLKINIPKTDFQMKANLSTLEPKILKYWKEIDVYGKLNGAVKNTNTTTSFEHEKHKKFILHDGPPYANGDIHVGHAYNKILKDIINKTGALSGYATAYIPGWDCHGLPIELVVEKKFGISAKMNLAGKIPATIDVSKEIDTEGNIENGDSPAAAFISKCSEYANSQVKSQMQSFIRLGVLGDFENAYKTMDPKFESNVIRALKKIMQNGYLISGVKPVHWCIKCGSALAEAEVEYEDKTSPAIDVVFRVDLKNNEKIASPILQKINKFVSENADSSLNFINKQEILIPIWTTTPWTLPANEALAISADLNYAIIALFDKRCFVLLEQELIESTMEKYAIQSDKYKILKIYSGSEFLDLGIVARHPFLDKCVKIVQSKYVTTDIGTGIVHTAPAHGYEDYVVGMQNGLKITTPVCKNGKFDNSIDFLSGKNIFKAQEDIIEILKTNGNLLHSGTITHSYPHCWRHHTPLISLATKQWFISMDVIGKYGKNLRELAMDAIENIVWVHPHGKERMINMIKNRPDWCISRQRVWGTPIPFFTKKITGELHPETEKLIDVVASEVQQHGIKFWQNLDSLDFLNKYSDTTKHDPNKYEKSNDTLDVWFDSGVTHFSVLKNSADLYAEGSDQYRGWFQSSLITSLAMNGIAPYKAVLSHGFTVDETGRKMSKSLGNVVDPIKTVEKYGADILRIWVSGSYPYNEISLSENIIKNNVEVYRKFRNTARYLLANLFDFSPKDDLLNQKEMLEIDKWIVREMLKFRDEMISTMIINTENKSNDNAYKLYFQFAKLKNLTIVTLSSFYFSIIKDRLYTMPPKSVGRRSAQTALYYILEIYVRLLAPFVSFTAEEIWLQISELFKNSDIQARPNSIFLDNYLPKFQCEDFASTVGMDDKYWDEMQLLFSAVTKEIEKLRVNENLGSSLETEVCLYCEDKWHDRLSIMFGNALIHHNNKNNDTDNNHYSNNNELKFVLITSDVQLFSAKEISSITNDTPPIQVSGVDGLWIIVKKTKRPKCERCWHHVEKIYTMQCSDIDNTNGNENSVTKISICARCTSNMFAQKTNFVLCNCDDMSIDEINNFIENNGEIRSFA